MLEEELTNRAGAGRVVVGYALNAKKLRKSSHDHSIPADGTKGTPSASDHPAATNDKSNSKCAVHDWSGGGLADILDSTSASCSDNEVPLVHFVQLDHEVPIPKQPHCSVLIHKLTEDIGNESKESKSKLQALEAYLQAHPSTVIVDPIECVQKVVSRARTCTHLTDIQNRLLGCCAFTQPGYVVIEEKVSDEAVLARLAQKQLVFPVICKPMQACGTAKSHSMVILTRSADVSLLEAPCVVQQYHDHGEVLYKVYVIDQDVMAFRRRSLPDLMVEAAGPNSGRRHCDGEQGSGETAPSACDPSRCRRLRSVAFDSRKNYPVYRDFVCDSCGEAAERDRSTELRSASQGCETDRILLALFEESAAAIRAEFGLSLFGFDAIVPRTGRCGDSSGGVTVIDVNYFPSYKEVRDFPARLRRFLASRSAAAASSTGEGAAHGTGACYL